MPVSVKRGWLFPQHSCGDLREVLDDLIEIGLMFIRPFSLKFMISPMKRETHGQKLTFLGRRQHRRRCFPALLRRRSGRETRRIPETMRRNGGFISSPTHPVPGDVPPENILALTDVFTNRISIAHNKVQNRGCFDGREKRSPTWSADRRTQKGRRLCYRAPVFLSLGWMHPCRGSNRQAKSFFEAPDSRESFPA